jgi:hypothetical protein
MILYFVDGNQGTDQMAAALAALSPANVVTVTSSTTDFSTEIATGTYQLGIFSAQEVYGTNYSTALAALASFVQGPTKGRAIVDSFTPFHSDDMRPFGATPTGAVNGTAVNLSVFGGGITNPMTLTNPIPPYSFFSTAESLTPGAFSAGTFFDPGNASGTDGEAAVVVGNPDPTWVAGGRSIVNGFLNDTAGPAGEQLYIHEIEALLTPVTTTAAPEPDSLTLLSLGAAGLAGCAWRRRAA